jgi:hypothetical protein
MAASETPSESRTPRVHRNALIEVTLPGGDVLALSFTGNLLELEGDERQIVFEARDLIANYRKAHAERGVDVPTLGQMAEAKGARNGAKAAAPVVGIPS